MVRRAVVIALGAASRPAASALAARLDVLGVAADVVVGPDPSSVDRASLAAIGRGPDPAWSGPTGAILTRRDAARVLGHEVAWERVAAGPDPALVVESSARLAAELGAALDDVAEAVGGPCDLLHLDAARDGLAYVLTPVAAEGLLAGVPDCLVPLPALLAAADVETFAVDPPLAEPGGPPAEGVEPILDHLVVVEAPLPLETFAACVAEVTAGAAPGDVVLALPAGRSRLLAAPEQVLVAVARTGATLETAPGPAAIGRADDVAGWLGSGADPFAAPGSLLHALAELAGGDTLVVGGRVLATATATEPLAVVAPDAATLAALDAELADEGGRDLARVLRYDGAADPASGPAALRTVAAEILELPFWTPAFCATVVRAAEAVGAFAPSPDDPVPGHEVSLASISPRLFAHLEDDLFLRVWPLVTRVWPYAEFHGLRDAFVIKYAAGQQDELRIHHDVAQLSASVKLNAGYDGAVLEFPRQGWDTTAVPVGHLVVWPSLVTHPHRTSRLRRGVKYGLTIWFELPPGALDGR